MWMIGATRGGDGWLWYGICLIILLFGGDERIPALLSAMLASGTGILLFQRLKKAINRKRPCALEPHCWATLLPPDQFSFPSGHSITAFAFAMSLGEFYPAMFAGLLFCALSVAVSRVLLGMHFLRDVIVGSLMGIGLGYSAALLLQTI